MFSPCPGFPVPIVGTWRPVAHHLEELQMNWLGWPGAEFGREPPSGHEESDHEEADHDETDQQELEPPAVADEAKKPDPIVNQLLRM